MIKAIIFDCFGVLTTEGWLAFKNKYFGNDPKKMREASDLNHQLDRGLISYEQALNGISELANVPTDELDSVLRDTVVDETLIEYIRTKLKPIYKIGMLSNVRKDWIEMVFTNSQLELFDGLCLSNETGVIKPDPKAYEMASRLLDVKPNEVVFIDDLEANVAGAEVIGMKGILYKNLTELKADLDNKLSANTEY